MVVLVEDVRRRAPDRSKHMGVRMCLLELFLLLEEDDGDAVGGGSVSVDEIGILYCFARMDIVLLSFSFCCYFLLDKIMSCLVFSNNDVDGTLLWDEKSSGEWWLNWFDTLFL